MIPDERLSLIRRLDAAEKVCEAAEQVERYMMNEALDAALTEWRRTKEQ